MRARASSGGRNPTAGAENNQDRRSAAGTGMKNEWINEARNVWDQLLQRVDQYIHMELKLQSNVGGAKVSAWIRFAKFQMKNEEISTAMAFSGTL